MYKFNNHFNASYIKNIMLRAAQFGNMDLLGF